MALAILLLLAGLMVAAAVWDAWKYIIPNAVVLAVLALYAPAALLLPVDWQWGLMGFGALLALGFALYTMGMIGAGDAKLLAAAGLWAGERVMDLVILTGIAGGGLALLLWLVRRVNQYYAFLPPWRAFSMGGPVPYGVAIALACIWLMVDGRLPAAAGL